MAELLQVLACGEESAALAFDHLAGNARGHSIRAALAGIAADESQHQVLLEGLRRSLPQPSADAVLHSAMRRFFMRLASHDLLVHCVRIVAIDSAVCLLLGTLLRRGNPVAASTAVRSILARILQDEARHVAIARACAVPLWESRRGKDIAAEARVRLAHVLEMRAHSFDVLCVDPDRLLARLRGDARLGVAA